MSCWLVNMLELSKEGLAVCYIATPFIVYRAGSGIDSASNRNTLVTLPSFSGKVKISQGSMQPEIVEIDTYARGFGATSCHNRASLARS